MPIAYDIENFYAGLVEHGLIIPTGVKGVYGRNAVFEDILARFDALVGRIAAPDGAQPMMFPPVLPRAVLDKVGYMGSFPQLSGAVHSFFGDEAQARELTARVQSGERWDDLLGITDLMLNPAACYPVYPAFSGLLPGDGRLVTLLAWVFRHEPSDEPTRQQSFRVREFVRMGRPQDVLEWRDGWLQRGLKILQGLGLPTQSDVASDPFFGRAGKMMAANQRDQRLKFEILVPVISRENPTALCSFNWHQDYFTSKFGIRGADESLAHTACLGFGLERVTLALIRAHGFDPGTWPDSVRTQLWP
ncbi:MAG: Archaeal seryl-tRNA synthetase-related sequence [Burkholderiaceae bacterium]|jgi:seryl-tRNA synthetase|nr:MAG: Archaeal seryl-tRNA synthetase-related sequence [Burkholderiaceae bacterium]